MAFNIVMPQMGESITEATILKWHRKVGEAIGKDETLYEISTDKVDAEIPSPLAGTLIEVLVQENETVPVGTLVARIGDASEIGKGGDASSAKAASTAPASVSAPDAITAGAGMPALPVADDSTLEGRLATKSSPLVRTMAAAHGVDLRQVPGSGLHGRVNKADMEAFLAKGPIPTSAPAKPAAPRPTPLALPPATVVPASLPGERTRVEPMSRMRKIIADNMVASRHTNAHVYTVWEFDMTQVSRLRKKHRRTFEETYGTKLSFMPFIMAAVSKALRAYPVVNASVDGDNIVYKLDVHLGIAVSLDWGLIVPVVKQADQLNLGGLARSLNDLAERARGKQLKPDEIQGGTFTITNPGVFGDTFGLPVINQPQAAILGMGAIKKRPVVLTDADGNDSLAIRETMWSGLSFDHRIIDGAVADQFMAVIKQELEHSTFGLE